SRGTTINHSPQAIRWLIAADSAFHLAVTFAPESASFWRDMAHFGMNSGSVFLRFRAENWTDKGLEAAVKAGDSILVAELADDAGMIKWRRYEGVADQALDIETGPMFSKAQRKFGVEIRRDQMVKPANSFPGFADYTEAMNFFLRANNANPTNAHARHHLYMVLAERAQWAELLKASKRQLQVATWDYEAWLARGLASTRLYQTADAAAAFDSAMAYMTPQQVASYKRFTRILPSKVWEGNEHLRDAETFNKLDAGEKNVTEEMAWALLDPLAVTPENEYRSEFYARVAFADLRWTAEDLDKRGSNTDRGDVHVRYGPPDRVLSMSAPGAGILLVWRYNNGLTFILDQVPMYGIARFAQPELVKLAGAETPVAFNNVPIARLIDTVGVRVAAFRGTHDSLDVVVVADIPAAKMLKGSELGGVLPFNINSRIIDSRAQARQVQSKTAKVNASTIPDRLAATWTQCVGPGVNFVRVEAYQPDTRRIAHGVLSVDAARPNGFGMSDILLGEKLSESSGNASRWSDVKIDPTFGTFRVGEPIGLLWENYKLTSDNGSVRYKVNIDVRSAAGGGIKGIVARVRSAFGATLGQGKENSGTIVVSFPRTAPARDVTVESMSLDLGTAKPGVYQLKVEVVDAVTGTTTSRVTQFRIEK
ncbi:MAG: GWxTD domain-containing protein, partial [Gemmatimonadaceae bacterium]